MQWNGIEIKWLITFKISNMAFGQSKEWKTIWISSKLMNTLRMFLGAKSKLMNSQNLGNLNAQTAKEIHNYWPTIKWTKHNYVLSRRNDKIDNRLLSMDILIIVNILFCVIAMVMKMMIIIFKMILMIHIVSAEHIQFDWDLIFLLQNRKFYSKYTLKFGGCGIGIDENIKKQMESLIMMYNTIDIWHYITINKVYLHMKMKGWKLFCDICMERLSWILSLLMKALSVEKKLIPKTVQKFGKTVAFIKILSILERLIHFNPCTNINSICLPRKSWHLS